MNQEEIIALAREAGFNPCSFMGGDFDLFNRYAALVEQATLAKFPSLDPVINWLENGCDPKEAAKELRLYAAAIRGMK